MKRKLIREIYEFLKSSRRVHDICEDPWYNCPMCEEGNDARYKEKKCTCRAEEYNTKLNELLTKIWNETKGLF
jgi:hypothetical protein